MTCVSDIRWGWSKFSEFSPFTTRSSFQERTRIEHCKTLRARHCSGLASQEWLRTHRKTGVSLS